MTSLEFHGQIINVEHSLDKFANSLTERKADARDLLQETILKALTHKDKYVDDTSFRAWTFTIMKNTFINNYRSQTRLNSHIDYNKDLLFINQVKSNGAFDPDSIYSAMEINQNIDQLKDSLRIPFIMHINGFKYREIATKLKLTMETVKNRIFLSRKLLMSLLEK